MNQSCDSSKRVMFFGVLLILGMNFFERGAARPFQKNSYPDPPMPFFEARAKSALQKSITSISLPIFLGDKSIVTLKRVLLNQANQWREMGGSPSGAIAALIAYKKTVMRQLIVKFIAFLVLLGGGIYMSISLFSEQSAIAAMVATISSVAVGLITNLFGTWRELDYVNLLLVLIREANDEQIKAIIDKVLEKL